MKLLYTILSFIYLFICSNLNAQTFAVINIQSLIDNNYAYNEILKEINIYQEKYLEKLEKKENELKKQFEDIEESKLLLNENEINLKINNYNKEFNEFSSLVDEFNFHYQNEIIILREKILKEIIIILEKYAIDENIDLILDSTSYLIASNSLDITENISNELTKLDLKLEYKNFEKN